MKQKRKLYLHATVSVEELVVPLDYVVQESLVYLMQHRDAVYCDPPSPAVVVPEEPTTGGEFAGVRGCSIAHAIVKYVAANYGDSDAYTACTLIDQWFEEDNEVHELVGQIVTHMNGDKILRFRSPDIPYNCESRVGLYVSDVNWQAAELELAKSMLSIISRLQSRKMPYGKIADHIARIAEMQVRGDDRECLLRYVERAEDAFREDQTTTDPGRKTFFV